MAEQETLRRLGRYEIVRELGRGAMGVVYEGHDPVVGRRVAIKTARRDVIESSTRADELMARFLREARAAGALNHPNIVTIYDAGEENGVAYIAMEFLEGTDLQKVIETQKRFEIPRVLEITSTVCSALEEAHEHGVIHRDIKPSNIVLLDNGAIKVADFGIARVSDSQLTQEGSVIGTPHYMSPEQFMGHPVDGRSDLFSVGIIVYEMLTGEKPFHGKSLSAVMHNVLHTMPVPPRYLNFGVSDCLSRVVMKALAKDPRDRYQSAETMSKALRECCKECPDPAVLQIAVATSDLAATVAPGGDPQATVVRNPDGTVVQPGQTAEIHPADAFAKTVSEGGSPKTIVTKHDEHAATEPDAPRSRWKVWVGAVAVVVVLAATGGIYSLLPDPLAAVSVLKVGEEAPKDAFKVIEVSWHGYASQANLADEVNPITTAADLVLGINEKEVFKPLRRISMPEEVTKATIVLKEPTPHFAYTVEAKGYVVADPHEATKSGGYASDVFNLLKNSPETEP